MNRKWIQSNRSSISLFSISLIPFLYFLPAGSEVVASVEAVVDASVEVLVAVDPPVVVLVVAPVVVVVAGVVVVGVAGQTFTPAGRH